MRSRYLCKRSLGLFVLFLAAIQLASNLTLDARTALDLNLKTVVTAEYDPPYNLTTISDKPLCLRPQLEGPGECSRH